MKQTENKLPTSEVPEKDLDAVSGGIGKLFLCCICGSSSYKAGRDGKYYCMTHWQQTAEGKAESQTDSIVTRNEHPDRDEPARRKSFFG